MSFIASGFCVVFSHRRPFHNATHSPSTNYLRPTFEGYSPQRPSNPYDRFRLYWPQFSNWKPNTSASRIKDSYSFSGSRGTFLPNEPQISERRNCDGVGGKG